MNKEIWKDVKDYEGVYLVSSEGRLKRVSTGRIKNQSLSKGGYNIVSLYAKGIVKTKFVHRLVGFSFLNEVDNKNEINHIDGNKLNNSISNLEWCNSSENTIHAYRTGLMNRNCVLGSKCHFSKLNESQVLNIKKLIKLGELKLKDIAIKFNVSADIISDIKRKKRWKHL